MCFARVYVCAPHVQLQYRDSCEIGELLGIEPASSVRAEGLLSTEPTLQPLKT